MKSKLLFSGLLAILITFSLNAREYLSVPGDPLNARIYTLDNGLKVYLSVNKDEPRIQTYIAVRVGSKNDPAETTGLAHYFEHLMFKGTDKFGTSDYAAEKILLDQIEELFEVYRNTTDEAERKKLYSDIDSISYAASNYTIANEYDKLMSSIGANGTNAFTGNDMTVYTENIPSNQLENWARIQLDRFENPVIRGFHTELETVYEEYNMYLAMDNAQMFQVILNSLFPNHPYGTQTTLGTAEHLKNPSIKNIKNYHAKWYVPNNMAICMSGDLDPDQAISIIEKYFGGMKPGQLEEIKHEPLLPLNEPKTVEMLGKEAPNVSIVWRSVNAADTRSLVDDITGYILHNDRAGLMDVDLIKSQKVLSCGAHAVHLADHGIFRIWGRNKDGQTLEEVRDLLMQEVAKVKNGEFSEELVEAIKANTKVALMKELESNMGRVDHFMGSFIDGIEWSDYVKQLDRIDEITKEDIVANANRVFTDGYVVVFKNQGTETHEGLEKPAITPIVINRDNESEFTKEIMLSQVEPIEPVFLDYKKDITFDSIDPGLELLYIPNTQNELFQFELYIENGTYNSRTLSTAATYTRYLGTPEMSPEEFNEKLYNTACQFQIAPYGNYTKIRISGLSEKMEEALNLAYDLMRNAVANEETLTNLKADILTQRANAKLNHRTNYQRLLNYSLFGENSPYLDILSNEQIQELSAAELLEEIKQLLATEHKILYYGPMDVAGLKNVVQKYYDPSQVMSQPSEVKIYPRKVTTGNSVLLAEYETPQAIFFQVHVTDRTFDPNQNAINNLYQSYFGAGMNSIVFQEMREARGLAYTAYYVLGETSYPAEKFFYMAYIGTQNDKLIDAYEAFEDIINNMPISETSFRICKENTLSDLRTSRITKMKILDNYLNNKRRGIDYDLRKLTFEQTQQLTLNDVIEYQQNYIKAKPYTYCILGDLKNMDLTIFETLGPVETVAKEDIFGY